MAASVHSSFTPAQSRVLPYFSGMAPQQLQPFTLPQQAQQQQQSFGMRSPAKFLQQRNMQEGTPTSVVKFVYPSSPLSNDMTNNQFRAGPSTPLANAPQQHFQQLQQLQMYQHFQAQIQAEAQARQAAFQLQQQQQQLRPTQQQPQEQQRLQRRRPPSLKRRPRSRSLSLCTAQELENPLSPRMVGASNTMVELASENEPIWQQLNQSMHNFIDTTVATSSEKLSDTEVDAIRRAFLAGARNGMVDEGENVDHDGSSHLGILLQAAQSVASFRTPQRSNRKRRTCEDETPVLDSSIFKRIKTVAAVR